MLDSFHKHHPNHKIHVFGTQADFTELGEVSSHQNTVLVDIGGNAELMQKFQQGHQGTTSVFAGVIQKLFNLGEYWRFLHIDGDVYLKRPCVHIVEKAFDEGYDIIGARRCYGNNPSGIPNIGQYPDTISTYFFAMNIEKIPKYPYDKLCRYCEGAEHPLGWFVLDAFDGVTHAAMNNGGKILYLNQNEFGSQDEMGKKISAYKSNMHLDMGSHLAHFGGVGSGYAYFNGKSRPEVGYAKWACGRWALFAMLFYGYEIDYNEPAVYGADGRWIDGSYDDNIMAQIVNDLNT